jgi:hypothetical protein
MKNSALLTTPAELLTSIERQRQYLVKEYVAPVPCPNSGCNQPVNVFDALGINVDDYDFRVYDRNPPYKCPHCGYKLAMVVPLFMTATPGHHWKIDEPLPPKNN